MHLHNIQKGISKSPDYVDKFGFKVPTSCGSIPQKNNWCDNWPEYYASKLEEQIEMIQRDYDDKEVKQLWPKLKSKLPTFFDGLNIKPSLLHGDLWYITRKYLLNRVSGALKNYLCAKQIPI